MNSHTTSTDRFEILLAEVALSLKKLLSQLRRDGRKVAAKMLHSSQETDVSSFTGLL